MKKIKTFESFSTNEGFTDRIKDAFKSKSTKEREKEEADLKSERDKNQKEYDKLRGELYSLDKDIEFMNGIISMSDPSGMYAPATDYGYSGHKAISREDVNRMMNKKRDLEEKLKKLENLLESFNYLNEDIKNLGNDRYDLPDFEEKKLKLIELFPNGCIDNDHYKYFGHDDEEDSYFGTKAEQRWRKRITNAIESAVGTIFDESDGFKIDCTMDYDDEKCNVSINKGEDYLSFDIDVDI